MSRMKINIHNNHIFNNLYVKFQGICKNDFIFMLCI